MRKVIACVLTIFVVLLVGCKASPSPDSVLKSYFAAAKSQDTKTMQSLSISDSSSTSTSVSSSSSATSDAESKKMMKLVFSKMDVTIEEAAKINGDNATVKAKITAPDTKKIMQNCIAAAFSSALSSAFSSSSSTSSNDASTAMTKMFANELSKSDVALSTTEMNVQLMKKDGQWKVKMTDNLTDAMTGGMYSYLKSVSDSFNTSSSSSSSSKAVASAKISSTSSTVKQATSSKAAPSKASTSSASFESTHAGWVSFSTDDAEIIAFGIRTGSVAYYDGQYWASPEYMDNLDNPQVVYENDISSSSSNSSSSDDGTYLVGGKTTNLTPGGDYEVEP